MRSRLLPARDEERGFALPFGQERDRSETRPAAAAEGSVAHALHAAEQNEQALMTRLHRVHDPDGMHLLRELRERIARLKERLRVETGS